MQFTKNFRVQSTIVKNNFASEDGGGIYVDTMSGVTVQSSTSIIGNVAKESGGGIYASKGSAMNITDTTISLNSAGSNGGAVFVENQVQLNLTNVNGSGNTVATSTSQNVNSGNGGFLFLSSEITVLVSSCNIVGNAAGRGGAVSMNISNFLTIRYSEINFNRALTAHGGALYGNSLNNINVENSQISNNVVVGDVITTDSTSAGGGGIFLVFQNLITMRNCIVANNEASIGGGGALFSFKSNAINLDNIHFYKNSMTASSKVSIGGGAIYLGSQSKITATSNLFEGNIVSHSNGGAVYDGGGFSALFIFFNCSFVGNVALDGACGAMGVGLQSNASFEALRFDNNTASSAGGALCLMGSSGTRIVTSRFVNNSVEQKGQIGNDEGRGGSMYLMGDIDTVIDRCQVIGNKALLGSAIYVDVPSLSPPTLSGNTFALNEASGAGTVFWTTKSPREIISMGPVNDDMQTGHNKHVSMSTDVSSLILKSEPRGLRNVAKTSTELNILDGIMRLWKGSIEILDPIPPCSHVSIPFRDYDDPDLQFGAIAETSCSFEAVGPITIGSVSECVRNYTINNVEQNYYFELEALEDEDGSLVSNLDAYSCPGHKILEFRSTTLNLPFGENHRYTLFRKCYDAFFEDGSVCNLSPVPIQGFAYTHRSVNDSINYLETKLGKSNLWMRNVAPYGETWATNPILSLPLAEDGGGGINGGIIGHMTSQPAGQKQPQPIAVTLSNLTRGSVYEPEKLFVNEYTTSMQLPRFALVDMYGQELSGELSQFVTLKADLTLSPNETACSPRVPGKGIVNILDTDLNTTVCGATLFVTTIDILCFPRKQLLFNVSRHFPGYSEALITIFDVSFRPCLVGEYLKDGMCVVCPDGTYSLQQDPTDWTQTQCLKCPQDATCLQGAIKSKAGYWRNSPLSSILQECPIPGSCKSTFMLVQNSAASVSKLINSYDSTTSVDSQCYEGYGGPLCSVCSRGYFKSGDRCVSCSSGVSTISPFVWIFLCLSVVAICGIL